jgi:hypothetical protein
MFFEYSRPIVATNTRPTILPFYVNNRETSMNPMDSSSRISRCISMDTVRRNEQGASLMVTDAYQAENLHKGKSSVPKKHPQSNANNSLTPMETSRSHSFTSNGTIVQCHPQISSSRYQFTNGEATLQKPRVYTPDDRPFVSQASHTILSSSSASSSLSMKEKILKDLTEHRYEHCLTVVNSSLE